MSEEKKDKIEEELSRIKEEMKELKDIIMEKRESRKEDDWENPKDVSSPRGFTFKIDSDLENSLEDLDLDIEGIDITLNNYVASIMQGVSDNIRRSMEEATRGIHQIEYDIAGKTQRNAQREMRRSMRNIRREERNAKRDLQDEISHGRVIHMNKLDENEIEEFYEIGTKMVSALSDPRRIKLLKLLEDGPAYQGDLSEKTGVKGGTFKHHMDSLITSKFVYQEATRGRYLITQLGVEALKLAEMLYRRYKFEEKEIQRKENPVDSDAVATHVNYEIKDSDLANQSDEESDQEIPEEFSESNGDEQE